MTDRASTPAPKGIPGLTHYGGYLFEEWDRRLRGTRGPKTFREMADSSPTIGALLFAFESLVRQAGYQVNPADESATAEAEATFVTECIEDMDGAWGDTVSEILTCLVYGFSLLETVYKPRNGPTLDASSSRFSDGRIGWARWSPRAQETIGRWQFDDAGNATAAYQQAPPKFAEVEIPLDRCLHFRVRARKNSPEGLSLLRNAYEPWYYYKNIARIEAISLERGGAGFPMARIPSQYMVDGDAIFESYKRMVTQIRVDEQSGIVIPSDTDESGKYQYDFEFKAPPRTTQFNTDPVLARYERLQLRSVLADFLTQGDTGVGSYAQSVNRTDLFLSSTNALLDSLADVINGQGIRRLFALNGIALDLAPTFTFNDVTRKDVAGFVEALVSLAGIGMVNPAEPDLKAHVYDMLDLPLPEETDEQAEDETAGGDAPDEPDEDEDTPEMPAQAAREPRKAVEDDGELTLADLVDVMEWFDRTNPEHAGLLGATIVTDDEE